MENLPGQEYLDTIRANDYENFIKLLQLQPDFYRKLSSAKKEALLTTLDYTKFSLVILNVLADYKSPDGFKNFVNFLQYFDPQQIVLDFKTFSSTCKDYVNFLLENGLGNKIIRSLKVVPIHIR